MRRWVKDHFGIVGFGFVISVLFGSLATWFRRCWQLLVHNFSISSPGRPIDVSELYIRWFEAVATDGVSVLQQGSS